MAVLKATSAFQTVEGTEQDDEIYGYQGSGNSYNTLNGNGGNDTLTGGNTSADFNGGLGDDLIIGSGVGVSFATYSDAKGAITASLETGVVTGAAGNDTLVNISGLLGSSYGDVLTGDAGINFLTGGRGSDTLTGGDGTDFFELVYLSGKQDIDVITDFSAGEGGDRIKLADFGYDYMVDYFLNNFARLVQSGADVLIQMDEDGNGSDPYYQTLAILRNVDKADLTAFNFQDSYSDPTKYGGREGNDRMVGTKADEEFGGWDGNDTIMGLGGNDDIEGQNGNDSLVGGAGNDTIFGDWAPSWSENTFGNDTLIGGSGDDKLYGGAGIDTASYADAPSAVVVSSIRASGGAGNDQLDSIENLIGSAYNDQLSGNTLVNRLEGGAGNDSLDGEVGADVMLGGLGDDQYTVDNIGDVVTEKTTEGTDTVLSSISYTLGDNLENLYLTTATALNGTGNSLNNLIEAGAGNHNLQGGAGNDRLNGGAGADTLVGGTGDDQYTVDDTADVVTENLEEGTDTVLSSINYTLGSNLENLRLTAATAVNGTGNSLNNIIWAGDGGNILDGATGIDTVSYAFSSAAVLASLNSRTATGGSGSDSLNNFENLVGSGFADSLTGNSLANIIEGGAGNDSLNGGAGADTLRGGLGDDQYTVANAGDVIAENDGEGTDTVLSNVSYTLSGNVENLRLTAAGTINATGNNLNNIIWAGAGDNILDGADGADTASYAFSSAGVVASLTTRTATGGSGNDSINNFENISGSNYADGLTGNALANILDGAGGSDTLNGGAGADTMTGGSGSDLFYVDNAGDLVIEAGPEGQGGTDTVYASISYSLGINVENLRIKTTGNVNATGNNLNNTLSAGTGDNVFDGGDGIDTVSYAYTSGGVNINLASTAAQATGGSGTDTFISIENIIGSNYGDTLQGSAGDNFIEGGGGIDTGSYSAATAGVTANLSSKTASGGAGNDTLLRIENLTGSGYADMLTGSAAANQLAGGAGDDKLNGSSGNDSLDGGDGNDLILGGLGVDQLTGGAGADSFDFNKLAEMGTGSTDWDVITDFNGAEGDRIDLSTLDANTTKGGYQEFSYIGSASFTAAGQLRYDSVAGVLYGSTDADLTAEFAIQLIGAPELSAAGILL